MTKIHQHVVANCQIPNLPATLDTFRLLWCTAVQADMSNTMASYKNFTNDSLGLLFVYLRASFRFAKKGDFCVVPLSQKWTNNFDYYFYSLVRWVFFATYNKHCFAQAIVTVACMFFSGSCFVAVDFSLFFSPRLNSFRIIYFCINCFVSHLSR